MYGRPWWSAALLDCQTNPGVMSPSDCNYLVRPAVTKLSPQLVQMSDLKQIDLELDPENGLKQIGFKTIFTTPASMATTSSTTTVFTTSLRDNSEPFQGLSNLIKLTDEDEHMFYKRFLLDYKIEQLLKCTARIGTDFETGIDIQTDFKFEIMRQHSSHPSVITYLRLDTGTIEYFSFDVGQTDFTKVIFDGKTLSCLGGAQHQCQNLTTGWPGGPVPVVVLEVKFKPREGAFEPGVVRDWQNNRYSISGSFYNAICGADSIQHLRNLGRA